MVSMLRKKGINKRRVMKSELINQRQQTIYEFVNQRSFTAIGEISEALGIKPSTVRRDIKCLELQKRLYSFHGGVSIANAYEKYELRTLKNAEAKKKIGHRAAQLVEPYDTIYIGGGSTCNAFAQELLQRQDLKEVLVVASSIHTAQLFVQKSPFKIMIAGGPISAVDESQTSPEAFTFMRRMHFKKAFVGTSGIDPEVGYTNPTFELNELKRVVLDQSNEVILLCDNTKIGMADSFIACPTERIGLIVTNYDKRTHSMVRDLQKAGSQVIEV